MYEPAPHATKPQLLDITNKFEVWINRSRLSQTVATTRDVCRNI